MTVRLITYSPLSYLYVDEIPNSSETVIFELPADLRIDILDFRQQGRNPALERYAVNAIEGHLTQMKRKGFNR